MKSLQRFHRLLAPSLFVLTLFVLPSCSRDSAQVDRSVPRSGQKGVSSRTIIAIRLSTTMSESDAENLLPGRIVVTGDQRAGAYPGRIVAASRAQVFNGQTIEEFPRLPAVPADPAELEEEASKQDMLVFLLEAGVEFGPGERVRVKVSDKVTVRGRALGEEIIITFTVAGGSSRGESDFLVTSTDPTPGAAGVGLAAVIRANVNQVPQGASLGGNVVVRGSISGAHSGGVTAADTSNAQSPAIVHAIGSRDAFKPGETVSVTFKSDISAASGNLTPYHLEFQVRPGLVSGGWTSTDILAALTDIVAVIPADFLPDTEGLEFAVVTSRGIILFSRDESAGAGAGGEVIDWNQSVTPINLGGDGFFARGAVPADTNDDGTLEIVVLLEDVDSEIARLQLFSIESGDRLEGSDPPSDFDSVNPRGLFATDIDSDGVTEFFVTHDDSSFIPIPPGVDPDDLAGVPIPAERTGHLTLFEFELGIPPGATIDPLDPESSIVPIFNPTRRPIPDFAKSKDVALVDLDNDGRIDVINHTDSDTLVVYRNQSTSTSANSFRRVGTLRGRDGANGAARKFVTLDVDVDGDNDILTWDATGALLHRNDFAPPSEESSERDSSDSDSSDNDEGSGILVTIPSPVEISTDGIRPSSNDKVIASNVDGDLDGRTDIVLARDSGALLVLRAQPDGTFSSENLGTHSVFGAMALADLNGDTGLDIAVAREGGMSLYPSVVDDDGRVTPPPPIRYFFECNPGDEASDCPDSEDGILEVVVRGDLPRRFSGFSMALDYDESSFSYLGYEPPASLDEEGRTEFSLCPTDNLIGCTGFASAGMRFVRDGATSVAANDVELGTFVFQIRQVETERTGTIQFMDFESGGSSFANVLTVAENGFEQAVPVGEFGGAIEIALSPPPPPELSILCVVEDRFARSARVRIDWTSELLRFDTIELGFSTPNEGRVIEHILDWGLGTSTFDIDLPGDVTVAATAVLANTPLEERPTEFCGFVNVFAPTGVTCTPTDRGTEISWSHEQTVDIFRVFRNGEQIQTISGSADELVARDTSPSEGGGDFYEVAAVRGGAESARGNCSGEDPTPCDTANPRPTFARLDSRLRASSPNVVRFRWQNGEAYDKLNATLLYEPFPGDNVNVTEDLLGALGENLAPNETEFVWEGDADRGGARPGIYTFTLLASNDVDDPADCGGQPTIDSDPVVFDSVEVEIPRLSDVGLLCRRLGISDLRVTWDEPWRGYDSRLTLVAEHSVDGVVIEDDTITIRDVLLSDDSFTFPALEPVGSWTVTLRATHESTSDPSILTAQCGPIPFTPMLVTGVVEVPIGQESFDISIFGTGVFGAVTGYDFELVYPGSITIDGFEDVVADESGLKRIRVQNLDDVFVDPDEDGDGSASGVVLLTTLVGRVETDAFELAGQDDEPLLLENAQLRFAGSDSLRGVETEPGVIRYRGRWVSIDQGETVAGSDDEIRIAVRLNFFAPESFPDYRYEGFQLHLEWDPDELELMPFREDDQVDSVLRNPGEFDQNGDGRLGELIPRLAQIDGEFLGNSNATGDLNVGWFEIPLATPNLVEPLRPVTNGDLIVCRFRSKLPANAEATFAPIRFVLNPTDPRENRTVFFPDEEVPGVTPVDAFFDGGLDIAATEDVLSVSSISPNSGPLTGGNVVTIRGRGFDGAGGEKPTLRLLSIQGETIEVPEDAITLDEVDGSRELRFVMPDVLGLYDGNPDTRILPETNTLIYSVQLTTSSGEAATPLPYVFEVPTLFSSDLTSVLASGGDILRLTGAGFSRETRVEFHVEGFDPFPASPLGGRPFDESGRSLVIIAPALPAPAESDAFREARLVVIFDDVAPGADPIATLTLSEIIRVLPSDGEVAPLRVTSVSPEEGFRCEETIVEIRGGGFTSSTRVRFGDQQAEVQFVSSLELLATAPTTPNAGTVMIEVENLGVIASGGPFVFDYLHPPAFVRGDADGSGSVTVADASLLAALVVGDSSTFPENRDALDANDDGSINLSDVIRILGHLFGGQGPLPEPFGEDGMTAGQDGDESDSICR